MFDARYRREMDAAGPRPEQMERLLSAIRTQPERTPGRAGPVVRRVLVAAAVCAALALTALAVSPTLREALVNALGRFQPYSQTVEGMSVTDQGIQVTVLSALSDGNTAQVYYEVRDLTGDRLDEFTDVRLETGPANWGEEDGPQFFAFGGGSYQCIRYDPEEKAALMLGGLKGDGPAAEKLVLNMDIDQIQPGSRYETIPIDHGWMAEEPLKNLTLENGKVVLAPGQNPGALESEFFSLSSFGFGEDGVLHLLLKAKVDTSAWDLEASEVRYHGGSSRSDTAPYYPRTARYAQTTDYRGMSDEEIELASPETSFAWNGETYFDCRTGITSADVAEGDVDWDEDIFAGLNTRPIIHGEWHLTFPVEMVEQIRVDMTGSRTNINQTTAETLYLSVLGASLESDSHGTNNALGYKLTVYLSDGRMLPGISVDSTFHSGNYSVNHWTFPEPVEPEEVTAIAIGQWYVPIEDGAAAEGHWLDALPE